MYFCEKCQQVFEKNRCTNCGKDGLREVRDSDFCYLTTVEESFGKSLIECLKNEEIECAVIPVGNGVRSKFALSLGNYQIYVPYNRFDDAIKIMEFFTENTSTEKLKQKILSNKDKWHFESKRAEKKIRKKLKIDSEIDILDYLEEKVEQAQTINDVGIMSDAEHGLVVKSGGIILWFSSETFTINI